MRSPVPTRQPLPTAMLLASALAGLLWDRFGATQTFIAGAAFSALAIVAIVLRQQPRS